MAGQPQGGRGRVLIAVPLLARRRQLLRPLIDAGFALAFNETGRFYDEPQLMAALGDAVAVLAGIEPYTERVLRTASHLRVIARLGVGFDNVDLEAARRHGVVVALTPDTNHEAVADHAMAMIAALLQELFAYDRTVRAGGWGTRFHPGVTGRTLGIVGFGRIGRATARRARAFGMRVLATSPGMPPEAMRREGVEPVALDELFAAADVVSLHAPLTPATHQLVNAARLSRMRPGAYLVNTARGGLVDQEALVAALREGRLAGAALDVFEDEPLPPDSPLRTLDRVILTPHVAGLSEDAVAQMTAMCIDNILRVLAGKAVPAERLPDGGTPAGASDSDGP